MTVVSSKKERSLALAKPDAKKPLFLFNAILLLFAATAICLGELPRFIDFTDYPLYSASLQIALTVLLVILGVAICYLSIKKFSARIKPILFIPFVVLSICVLVGVFMTPEVIEIPYKDHSVFSFGMEKKVSYAISGVATFFALWILFDFGPIGKAKREHWFWFYEILVAIAFATVIYSLIVEFPLYQRIFVEHSIESRYAPVSWLGQKNAFARYLMIGIFAELMLLYIDRRYFRYVSIAALSFVLILTMAKTPIILTFGLILFYWAFMAAIHWKKRRIVSVIHLAALGVVLLTILILFLLPSESLGGIGDIIAAIKNNSEIGGGGTVDDRIYIWNQCIKIWNMSTASRLCGNGEFIYATLIGPAIDAQVFFPTSHNVWIELLGRSGILGCIAYGTIMVYLLYRLVRCFLARRKDVWVSLAFFIVLLIHGALESTWLFDCSYEAITLCALVVWPWLAKDGDQSISVLPSGKPSTASLHRIGRLALLASPLLIPMIYSSMPIYVSLPLLILIGVAQLIFIALLSKKERVLQVGFPILIADFIGVIFVRYYPFISLFDSMATGAICLAVSFGAHFLLPAITKSERDYDFFGLERLYVRSLIRQRYDDESMPISD